MSESIQTSLTAGSYVIEVSSAGHYGDIGQYVLSGTLPGGGLPAQNGHYLVEGTDGDDNINITLADGAYHVNMNGAGYRPRRHHHHAVRRPRRRRE